MSCTKISGGFVCSGTADFFKMELESGRDIWFEHHKNFGCFFWLDEDCVKEFDKWYEDEELLAFHDKYYGVKR